MHLQRIKPKSIRTHVFLYVVLSVLILCILLAGSMYWASQRLILNAAHDTNMALLHAQATTYKQIMNNQLQFARLLYNSIGVKQLMTAPSLRPYDLFVHYNAINSMVMSNDFIHSVYVFNRVAGQIYVMGKGACIRTDASFYDQAMLQILDQQSPLALVNNAPSARRIVVPAEIQLQSADQIGEVFPIILGISSSGPSPRFRSALVVNLYTSLQTPADAAYADEEPSHLHMLDDHDKVVSSTQSGRFLEDWSTHPTYQKTRTGQSNGSLVFHDEGKKKILTFLELPGYRRTLVSVVPYARFADQVNLLGTSTLFLLFGTLSLGLLLSLLVSRRIVKPFSTFFRQVSRSTGPAAAGPLSYDDLTQFAAQAAREYERLDRLERFRLQNTSFLREYRLRQLLEREDANLPAPTLLQEQASAQGDPISRSLDVSRPVCFVYMLAESKQGKPSSTYIMDQLIAELMPKTANWELIALVENQWLLVYQAKEPARLNALTDEILPRLQQLQQTMRGTFDQGLACALRTNIPDAAHWHAAMRHVRRRMEQRYLVSRDPMITQDPPFDPDWDIKPFLACVQQIQGIMLEGHARALPDAWARMRSSLSMAGLQNARNAVGMLTTALFTTLLGMNATEVERIGVDYAQIARQAETAATLDEALTILRKIPTILLERSGSAPGDRNGEIVTYTKEYVESHLQDPALNFAMVADSLRMSGAMLKRIFYQQTGIALSTYIRDIRLQEAQRALVESSAPIDRILDNIGWENKKYFFSVFKQVHGMTPTEYRQSRRMPGYRSDIEEASAP